MLHEVGLAETKGTGIRTMREAMERANLTLSLFESDREKDTFTVTLLVHHFLGPKDLEWLAQFKEHGLNEAEARALFVVREVGAINNAAYRDINHVDTLTASAHLRRLRDLGLIEQRGKSTATYYVPTLYLRDPSGSPLPAEQSPSPAPLPEGLTVLPEGFNPSGKTLPEGFTDMPEELRQDIKGLGRRAAPYDVMNVVLRLCAWRPLKPAELGSILNRSARWIRDSYLHPMLRGGELEYLHSDNPAHPQQAYRTTAKGLERIGE